MACGTDRAIAFFNVGCRRVFETHQNKARKVRLEDSTTPYNLPRSNKAMALGDRPVPLCLPA